MNKEKKVVFMDVGNEVNFEEVEKNELFYAIFKRVRKMLDNNIDENNKDKTYDSNNTNNTVEDEDLYQTPF